jgi:hypothetical protein
MPRTRPATLRREDLPDIVTVNEFAEYDRSDPRTVRDDAKAGLIPGAYQRGKSWRIDMTVYFEAMSGGAQ